jgi:hypothetical protein
MQRSSTFWFGLPREEISAVERYRLTAKRDTRLEQHMLPARPDSADASRGPREPRDPLELQRGLDVQVLEDSAFDRLFPHAED